MKPIFYTVGTLGWLASAAGACYVGGYLMFFKGLIQFIEAVKLTPVSSEGIAFGVVKILLASFVGWILFIVGGLISSFFFGMAKACK